MKQFFKAANPGDGTGIFFAIEAFDEIRMRLRLQNEGAQSNRGGIAGKRDSAIQSTRRSNVSALA